MLYSMVHSGQLKVNVTAGEGDKLFVVNIVILNNEDA